MKARALWITAQGQCEMREEPLPRFSADLIPLRMLASGISRGTESLVFHGRVPPSQFAAMRAPMQDGNFPFPVKYGYSAVGVAPDGRRLFALHPHQDHALVPAAFCVPVPQDVPTARAVLASNMETALNIVWDAAPLPGERVLVIGAGIVGLLTASLLARVPAVKVTVVDIEPGRAEVARKLGCDFTLPEGAPGEQELIVHASASEDGLKLALKRAGFEARIVEASWYGDRMPAVPLGEAFHARRLKLISSQVGAVAAPMRGRRTHAQRLAMALALLEDPRLDVLLETPTAFADLPAAYGQLLSGGLCHVVTY